MLSLEENNEWFFLLVKSISELSLEPTCNENAVNWLMCYLLLLGFLLHLMQTTLYWKISNFSKYDGKSKLSYGLLSLRIVSWWFCSVVAEVFHSFNSKFRWCLNGSWSISRNISVFSLTCIIDCLPLLYNVSYLECLHSGSRI